MVTIFKASQEYEVAIWAAYNVAYRQQAPATGRRRWSEVNTLLYVNWFDPSTAVSTSLIRLAKQVT